MISIVSFDYFTPFDYIDGGFTEVWAYSPEFEWLGYDTVNFVVGLGSILIFALLQIATVMFAVMLIPCIARCPCKWFRKNFAFDPVWDNSLNFVHGTFFSIMVCMAVSKEMLPYWEEFVHVDRVSMVFALVFLIILCLYLLFGFYFVFYKSKQLAIKHRSETEEANIKKIDFLHESLAFQRKFKGQAEEMNEMNEEILDKLR